MQNSLSTKSTVICFLHSCFYTIVLFYFFIDKVIPFRNSFLFEILPNILFYVGHFQLLSPSMKVKLPPRRTRRRSRDRGGALNDLVCPLEFEVPNFVSSNILPSGYYIRCEDFTSIPMSPSLFLEPHRFASSFSFCDIHHCRNQILKMKNEIYCRQLSGHIAVIYNPRLKCNFCTETTHNL